MAAAAAQAAGLTYTPTDEIPQIVSNLRKSFLSLKTYDLEYRKNQLKQLAFCIQDNAEAICEAIKKDLGRSDWESTFAEVTTTVNECIEYVHNLDKWAKDEKPWSGIAWASHGTIIRKQPKGTVLIIGAWNYPVTVTVGPFIAAIAAGNTVILKPSEVSAHTARLLGEIIPKYLDPASYVVINGAISETTLLLDQRFEHIFFTGNGTVGRVVQEKAAKWLCPVSLELGGKSPVVVDDSADLKIAAHRILWGKLLNAGQTCIAPDYVICKKSVQDKLIAEMKTVFNEFYPEGPAKSKDLGRIINEGHHARLTSVLDGTKGDVVIGGDNDVSTKYLAPTVIANVTGDDSVMQGELFGPILPIVPVKDLDEAITFINSRDQPLALYAFGNSSSVKKVVDSTRSGGAVIGDTILHCAISQLPFGGTGPSGHGSYHGKAGFDCFTHQRAVLLAPHTGVVGRTIEKVMSFRYPPYTTANLNKYKLLMGNRLPFSKPSSPHASKTKVCF
ncbi:aldehyde dehydrogenase [Tilletiaria anomala UBC 951]|uniref:Aldehyde dehydrogenase n=1 Tax=Tilletiaria anomala (strain ATCC 24038 / CBS 436.72 / UBC 951) TaxID=1037660 RepID=A0A066W780_TILAU|nr:aldehyde dehydrogenase [Tilletiaria anomala UBC 951]KDN46650.1 aldehyde dehydrogenase [Tilletiaria anomala UBC 951]